MRTSSHGDVVSQAVHALKEMDLDGPFGQYVRVIAHSDAGKEDQAAKAEEREAAKAEREAEREARKADAKSNGNGNGNGNGKRQRQQLTQNRPLQKEGLIGPPSRCGRVSVPRVLRRFSASRPSEDARASDRPAVCRRFWHVAQ